MDWVAGAPVFYHQFLRRTFESLLVIGGWITGYLLSLAMDKSNPNCGVNIMPKQSTTNDIEDCRLSMVENQTNMSIELGSHSDYQYNMTH